MLNKLSHDIYRHRLGTLGMLGITFFHHTAELIVFIVIDLAPLLNKSLQTIPNKTRMSLYFNLSNFYS